MAIAIDAVAPFFPGAPLMQVTRSGKTDGITEPHADVCIPAATPFATPVFWVVDMIVTSISNGNDKVVSVLKIKPSSTVVVVVVVDVVVGAR